MTLSLKCTKFSSAFVLGPIQVVKTIKNLNYLGNLNKWHKFKRSQILLQFEYTIHWILKPNWKPSANCTGKLTQFWQIHIKMDCKNIFNTKKTHVIYHFNPLFVVCHICHFDLLSLMYIEVWSGLEAIWKTSEKEGRVPLEILMILYIVFVGTELHLDIQFLPAFSRIFKKLKKG